MAQNYNELLMLKASVAAIRRRAMDVVQDLDGVMAQINASLPESKPQIKVPAGKKARQEYYKGVFDKL